MPERVLRSDNPGCCVCGLLLALVLASCIQGSKQQEGEENGAGKDAPVRNELHKLRKQFGNRMILGVYANADSSLQPCLGRLAALPALLDLHPTVNSLTDQEVDEMFMCLEAKLKSGSDLPWKNFAAQVELWCDIDGALRVPLVDVEGEPAYYFELMVGAEAFAEILDSVSSSGDRVFDGSTTGEIRAALMLPRLLAQLPKRQRLRVLARYYLEAAETMWEPPQ